MSSGAVKMPSAAGSFITSQGLKYSGALVRVRVRLRLRARARARARARVGTRVITSSSGKLFARRSPWESPWFGLGLGSGLGLGVAYELRRVHLSGS